MGTYVLNKAWNRQFLAAGTAAHFMPSLKHSCFEARSLQVASNNRSVMAASDNYCVVFFIWHNNLLSLISSLNFIAFS
jgi:hypothetical protein